MKNKNQENDLEKFRNNLKTDYEKLKENFQFIWEDETETEDKYENFAKQYYDKLFKEYCIADLSNYKSGRYNLN